MVKLFSFITPQTITSVGCSYGNADLANRLVLENTVFSLVTVTAVGYLLLFNDSLRRFYIPLSIIVDLSILLKFVGAALYLAFHPYSETSGNCSEMFVSRLYYALIMFGELHQIFLLGKVLGIAQLQFKLGKSFNMSLENALNICAASIFVLMLISFVIPSFHGLWEMFGAIVLLVDDFWVIVVSLIQIHLIRKYKSISDQYRENQLISATDTALSMFESISIIQMIPSGFCIIKTLLVLMGIAVLEGTASSAALNLGDLSIMLFYLKVLIITQSVANIRIETVSA